MDRNVAEILLDRYLKGETSPEENALVEHWLEENNNPHAEWQQFTESQKEEWLAGVFGQIQDSIKGEKTKVIAMPQRKQVWWRIAAVAAVFIICFTLYLKWPSWQDRLHPADLIALNALTNQQKQISLPDGSKVWVNSKSQLKYPAQFDGKTREVYLSGEAYFDIHHDAGKPFIIHTGKIITTVLGTAFNIREDEQSQTINITVTRGKVSVGDGTRQLGILTPNQQISVNLLTSQSTQIDVDAKQAIAWQKELHFEDITFGEAVLQLEQRFNVKINFSNDKLKECRFTGTAISGADLDKVLKVICAFNNATYARKADGSILIDGSGCN